MKKLPVVRPSVLVLEGLWSDTSDALRAAGADVVEGHPWTDAYTKDLEDGAFNALVLTGGSDINPVLYTDDPAHPTVYGIDHTRDAVEWEALEVALSLGIPVLGICRGSQMMTAFRGGRLKQHIDGHRGTDHPVYSAPGARTFRTACNSRTMDVISLHHQCIAEPGPGMRVAAYAPDGTPEAIESIDGLWLGCQFHPELAAFDNVNAYSIFRWLVGKAAAHAGGRAQPLPFRVARRNAVQPPVAVVVHEEDEYGSGWDAQAWGDPRGFRAIDPCESGGTFPPKASPPHKPRKAGDPSLPSMRTDEASGITFEEVTGEVVDPAGCLLICPMCAMLFDNSQDRYDHAQYVHGYTVLQYDLDDYIVEPPADSPDWEPSRLRAARPLRALN